MNKISRIISGVILVIIGLFIIFNLTLESWHFTALWGLFFIVIGLILFFNKKEDEIEEIKGFNKEK